jgi:hypothetical protein
VHKSHGPFQAVEVPIGLSIVKAPAVRAVAQRLDAGFPPRRPGFAYGQHVGFVVDKAALGQSPSTSVSPANHSTDFSIIIITQG